MQSRGKKISIIISIATLLTSCSILPMAKREKITAEIWTTAPEKNLFLQKTAIKPVEDPDFIIETKEEKTYQTIQGFGASLTESSAYVISTLSKEEKNKLMQQLFSPDSGIGINLLRQPMGASDFALSLYTYDDTPNNTDDFELKYFSIDRDKKYIIPLLKQAKKINPDIKIMASPWSPPAWMKTGKNLIGSEGGRLRKDCYGAYADYFVRFIEEYKKEGIEIDYITPQNEIEYAPPHYTGMLMSAKEQAEFISYFLVPAFKKSGLNTKIFCYDHNWDGKKTVELIMSYYKSKENIYGIAWHHYSGSPQVMTELAKKYPDKQMWVTEAGNGRWIWRGSMAGTFREGIKEAVEIFKNNSSALILWNIALDQNNGPIVYKNNANYGLVEIEIDPQTKTGKIKEKKSGWYFLAHFSRFVKRGAVRIESYDKKEKNFNHVAFLNPDKSQAVVLYNPLFTDISGIIIIKGNKIPVTVPAGGGVTVYAEPEE